MVFIKNKMKKIEVMIRNIKISGPRYLIWDVLYQLTKLFHKRKPEIIKKSKIIKKKVNNYEMFIDSNGKGIHRDLKLHGTRESVSLEIVKSILKEGDVVLDASANIGYYVILESLAVGSNGIVYAVEPVKKSFNLLKKNIELNRLENVKTYNLAFNDKLGRLDINIESESNLNTPVKIKINGNKKTESVKATTLDSFLKGKKKPNFMRMDIEGFEDVVFQGGEKTLDSLKTIFVELHFPLLGKERMKRLLHNLKGKGFEVHKAVLEWERWEDESSLSGRIVNYLHRKRSRPLVFDNMTIESLLRNKNFMEGHHSLEVFFVKNR